MSKRRNQADELNQAGELTVAQLKDISGGCLPCDFKDCRGGATTTPPGGLSGIRQFIHSYGY